MDDFKERLDKSLYMFKDNASDSNNTSVIFEEEFNYGV